MCVGVIVLICRKLVIEKLWLLCFDWNLIIIDLGFNWKFIFLWLMSEKGVGVRKSILWGNGIMILGCFYFFIEFFLLIFYIFCIDDKII